jgi:hypothetical protein
VEIRSKSPRKIEFSAPLYKNGESYAYHTIERRLLYQTIRLDELKTYRFMILFHPTTSSRVLVSRGQILSLRVIFLAPKATETDAARHELSNKGLESSFPSTEA